MNNEVYGIGAVAIALVGLVWKIWHDSNEQSKKIIELVEKNAVVQERLSANVQENTKVTTQQGVEAHRRNEAMMKLLIKVMEQTGKQL